MPNGEMRSNAGFQGPEREYIPLERALAVGDHWSPGPSRISTPKPRVMGPGPACTVNGMPLGTLASLESEASGRKYLDSRLRAIESSRKALTGETGGRSGSMLDKPRSQDEDRIVVSKLRRNAEKFGKDEKGREVEGERPEVEVVCYNCRRKEHGFMDCVVSCDRCGRGGHRTIDCGLVGGEE